MVSNCGLGWNKHLAEAVGTEAAIKRSLKFILRNRAFESNCAN